MTKFDFVQLQTIRLAQITPIEHGTWTSCRTGKHRAGAGERYWTELRGDVILLYPAAEIVRLFETHLQHRNSSIHPSGLQRLLEKKRESMKPQSYFSYIHSYSTRVPKLKVVPVLFRVCKTVVRPGDFSVSFTAYNSSASFPRKTLSLTFDSEEAMGPWRDAVKRVPEVFQKTISDFSLIRHVGHGATSEVFLVRDRFSHEKIALKAIEKQRAFSYNDSTRRIIDERIVHSRMRKHPYILEMNHAFETPERLYIATEYCSRGDLFHYLGRISKSRESEQVPSALNGHRLEEKTARMVAAEVLLALEALHDQGIWYRDLKPENVLVADNGHVKLGDFGAAKITNPRRSVPRSTSTVGTIEYLAPEMVKERPYNRAVDLWAYGIFICELLNGETPFEGDSDKLTYENIINSPLVLPNTMPSEARNLVRKLLCRDPSKRCGSSVNGWQDIKRHPWFDGIDWETLLLQPSRIGPFPPCWEGNTTEGEYNFDDSSERNKRISVEKFAQDQQRDYNYTAAVRYKHECGASSVRIPKNPLSCGRKFRGILGAYACGDRRKSNSPLSLEPQEPLSIPDAKTGNVSYVTWAPNEGAQWQARQPPDFRIENETGFWKKLSSGLSKLVSFVR